MLFRSTGAGAELRVPLGVSIIGGLLLSQLLTLYTTPVIYLQVEWLRGKTGFAGHRSLTAEKALDAELAR